MNDEVQMASRMYVQKQLFEALDPEEPCIICGENVPLTFEEFCTKGRPVKVCEKCKAAVLAVRQNMEAVAEQRAILD